MSKEKTSTSLFVRVSSLARLGTNQVPGFYISPKLSMRLLRFGKRSGTIGQSTSHRRRLKKQKRRRLGRLAINPTDVITGIHDTIQAAHTSRRSVGVVPGSDFEKMAYCDGKLSKNDKICF